MTGTFPILLLCFRPCFWALNPKTLNPPTHAGGHIRLTQQLLQSLSSWWTGLTSLYFEGIITVQSLGRAALPKLDRLALVNVSPVPFRVDFNALPPALSFIELQNAVIIYHGRESSTSLEQQVRS